MAKESGDSLMGKGELSILMAENRQKLPIRRQRAESSVFVNVMEDDEVDYENENIVIGEENVESNNSVGHEGDDCEANYADITGPVDVDLVQNEFFEVYDNFEVQSGDAGCEETNGNDGDSADDIWNDDDIPDPISDDEEEGHATQYKCGVGSDELIHLEKTFSSANDFKYALLRYSLKTQYDVKLYISASNKIGAKCTNGDCPWRVYCSFEKSRNKLMTKVCLMEHTCVQTGYTKLLKSGSIAQLFEERLRSNPKIKSQEMVDEIKREYNMIVTGISV